MFFKKIRINRLLKKIKLMQHNRVHNQPSSVAILKEIALYHQLAKIYKSLEGHKKYPFAADMVIECYRASAVIEDSEAQFLVATQLLEEAKFREKLQLEGVFANAANERRTKQLFEEALAYLKTAVSLNHIQAKRLYGLCFINGWGTPVDQDHGFEFIVSSIDQENSWHKVPQIFAEMGLNKPEFFSVLMKHRK